MVKLKGPAISGTAAGALGGTLTYSHIGGINYAKRTARPRTSNTYEQVSTRAIMQFLTVEWLHRSQAQRDSWIPLADQLHLPPYQAYLHYNVPRWHSHTAPSATYPPPSGTAVGSTGGWDAIVQGRTIRMQIQMGVPSNNWGVTLYSKPGLGSTVIGPYLIHVIPCYTSGWYYWSTRPLAPGTYYLTYGRFTQNGYRTTVFGTTLTRVVT